MSENYNIKETEAKWQKAWEDNNVFAVDNAKSDKTYYVLEMFPYPSGKIHIGHLRNYAIGDVVARYKRSCGYQVLHPMGWDAFGLPAENAAIENNVHPGDWTYQNIDQMRGPLRSIGLSYDWEREIATCSPDYYKHEQKMFLDFLKNGIAYRKESMVNWDPIDNTVLANEQVIDGCGWRSGVPVERRKLNQWFLKITDFAEDLLDGLSTLKEWPERVVNMQEKWIGKSEGATIFFSIIGSDEKLEVYTTRPDTLFGASFCAISPNHPLANKLAEGNSELADFIEECNKMGMAEEIIERAEKKGIDIGLKVQHPFDENITLPIYVANFILMDYGSGAVFACPAHDQRDLDFARKYDLPVREVVLPKDMTEEKFNVGKEAYTGDGTMINSGFLNGLSANKAKATATYRLEELAIGNRKINYRLRDWGISRQRYWGCPIPIIYCDDCGSVPVPDDQLPVELPKDVSFDKLGNPLDHHPTWKHIDCPSCGKAATRETDTFDTFFESSWYFARFCSPDADNGLDKSACNKWLPVDQYIGGIEHAVLHLLYARFFTRALNKCGYIDVKEPFTRLLTQGMVCHETYQNKDGKWLFPDDVIKQDGKYTHIKTGEEVIVGRTQKMSKSKKNVVDPLEIIQSYGADTARLFMLSDSPPERDLEWSDSGIDGAWRFVNRLWRLGENIKDKIAGLTDDYSSVSDKEAVKLRKIVHKTVAAITSDLDNFYLNKSVARVRELTNAIEAIKLENEDCKLALKESVEILVRLILPMIPHIAEELWESLGFSGNVNQWPVADKDLLIDNVVTIAVQHNGKLRGTLELPVNISREEAEKAALELPSIQKILAEKELRKIIVVQNKIVNVVA